MDKDQNGFGGAASVAAEGSASAGEPFLFKEDQPEGELFSIFDGVSAPAAAGGADAAQPPHEPRARIDAVSSEAAPAQGGPAPKKKKKRKIWRISVVTVLCLAVVLGSAVGLYFTGVLPRRLSDGIASLFSAINLPAATSPSVSVNADPVSVAVHGRKLPDGMNGVFIDLDKDVSDASVASYTAFVADLEENFSFLRNFITDTVLIRPDAAGKFASLHDAYGTQVDVLRDYMRLSAENGYFTVLVLDDAMLFNNDGTYNDAFVNYYLGNYPYDAVLFSSSRMIVENSLSEGMAYFGALVRGAYPHVYVGMEAEQPVAAEAVIKSGQVDFVAFTGRVSTVSTGGGFAAMCAEWNSLAAKYPSVAFYCKHRSDLVMTGGADWTEPTELSAQVRVLWEQALVRGSMYFDLSALKQNLSQSSLSLSRLLYSGAEEGFGVSNILYNENGTVTFTGTANDGYKAFCNRSEISVKDKNFTFEAPLVPGKNSFVFFQAGQRLTYDIFRTAPFFRSVPAASDIILEKDRTLLVRAVCLQDCTVTCTLGGQEAVLSPAAAPGDVEVPQGYAMFACRMRFGGDNETNVKLGALTLRAQYDAGFETAVCGEVYLSGAKANPSAQATAPVLLPYPETAALVAAGGAQCVSPYCGNGESALMCRVTEDDTEQLGTVSEYNTYHADGSAICAGTVDYIKNMQVTSAGYLRYELRSGVNVYGVNCELVCGGHTMPENRVTIDRVDDSQLGSTDVYFTTDWLPPVTVQCKPQAYTSGYAGYSYNIDAFTAEYVDVRFAYTAACYDPERLQFSSQSPFVSAEVLQDGDAMILRLKLQQTGQFYGYDLERCEDGEMKLSFKKHSDASLYGKTVMLDAGHGGLSMTGTALLDDSVAEKTVTLAIAQKTKQMLESRGATVFMTRTRDTSIELDERTAMMAAADPDIFVSIHCDGANNTSESGTHTFYFRPYSMPLARAINDSLSLIYRTKIYQPGDTNFPSVDKKIKFYPFFVTRLNQCPSVLVETGFMSNQIEGRILANDNTQYWLAQGLTDGIENYFRTNY